jgi:hypothetical protein
MILSAEQQKEKALAYIDRAIEEMKNRIQDCEDSIAAIQDFPFYADAKKIYSPGMTLGEFTLLARVLCQNWEEEDYRVNYDRCIRWNFNFTQTRVVEEGYKTILSAYRAIRKEIEGFQVGVDDGFVYTDVLSASRIGLSEEQLIEFL